MSASIHFHLSRDELLVGADGVGADDATTYLTVENDTSSVEVTVFGTPDELHAFALRMVAAVEAEWPETAVEQVYAFAADLFDEHGTYLRTVREDMDDEDRCSNGGCNCTTMERVEIDALTLVEPS